MSRQQCVCTSMVNVRWACRSHNTPYFHIFKKNDRRNQQPYKPRRVGVVSTELRHPTNKCRGQLNWTNCKQIKTRPSHLTEQRTRHLRAPLPTCHNAYVCRRWATFSGVTRDNIQHASRIETELLQMHLRIRNGVMHTRWLYKNASARASPNVNEALPSLKQRTQNYECIHMRYRSSTDSALCAEGNDSTMLYTGTSLVDGKWHNEKTFILVLLTQNLAHAAQNLPIHDAKKMSSNTEMD